MNAIVAINEFANVVLSVSLAFALQDSGYAYFLLILAIVSGVYHPFNKAPRPVPGAIPVKTV